MPAVWSFLRQYVSGTELWMLLPVVAAVCVAVGSFVYLQSAVEKRATVTDAEKAEWKQKLLDEGKKVIERAKQKAAADAAAIKANIQEKLHHTQQQQQQQQQQAELSNNTDTAQPSAAKEESTSANGELRQRRGKGAEQADSKQEIAAAVAAAAADDSGAASDNDWELVDNDSIERAEESQYEPPIEYQQAVEAFIEALHETPQTAVDELHAAVKAFYAVVCGVLDGSSNITPLPSTRDSTTDPAAPPPSAANLSASERYATRNVLLSRLVDTQSMHALHEVVGAHPGTTLAADAEHLHNLLVPVLHSH